MLIFLLGLLGFLADSSRSEMDGFHLGEGQRVLTAPRLKVVETQRVGQFECFRVEGPATVSMLRFKEGSLASIFGSCWTRSLGRTRIQLGMTRAQVEAALGPAHEHDQAKDLDTYHLVLLPVSSSLSLAA